MCIYGTMLLGDSLTPALLDREGRSDAVKIRLQVATFSDSTLPIVHLDYLCCAWPVCYIGYCLGSPEADHTEYHRFADAVILRKLDKRSINSLVVIYGFISSITCYLDRCAMKWILNLQVQATSDARQCVFCHDKSI